MAALPLRVHLLRPDARAPQRKSPGAAGYDLFAAGELSLAPRSRALIPTGIALAIPPGHYGRVAPRSSLAIRGVDVGAGVVDSDYRGEVLVLLVNQSSADFQVRAGDRIAQLILERISAPALEVVESLDSTERGSGGFGSTGV